MTRLERLKDALLGLDEEILALEAFTSRGEVPPDDVLSTAIIMIGQMKARMQGVLNVHGDVGGSTRAGKMPALPVQAALPGPPPETDPYQLGPDPPPLWFRQGQFE